jgi:Fic/DOC family
VERDSEFAPSALHNVRPGRRRQRIVPLVPRSEHIDILAAMSRPRQSRYRDREESRFYCVRGMSPEETWQALGDELARVLDDAQRAFWRRPLRMNAERVRWWHGAIFARRFPHDGGHFRSELAFFGVVTPGGGMRQLAGADPLAIRGELAAVCASFNGQVGVLGDPDAASVLDRARAAAALYAGILRVHPFADGNHRTAFVALSAALWSLHMPNVRFIGAEEMIAHDDALVPALVSGPGHAEPFAQLLATRIERANADPA